MVSIFHNEIHLFTFVFDDFKRGSSKVPPRVTPRVVHQLRPIIMNIDFVSSLSQATKSAKERSPKFIDHRSPQTKVLEVTIPLKLLYSQIFNLKCWNCSHASNKILLKLF